MRWFYSFLNDNKIMNENNNQLISIRIAYMLVSSWATFRIERRKTKHLGWCSNKSLLPSLFLYFSYGSNAETAPDHTKMIIPYGQSAIAASLLHSAHPLFFSSSLSSHIFHMIEHSMIEILPPPWKRSWPISDRHSLDDAALSLAKPL